MEQTFKRISLSKFQESFEGAAPNRNTLKRHIENGTIPGEKIGARYYIHVDLFGNLYRQQLVAGIDAEALNDPTFQNLIKGY